jgi:O-antigen ligase
MAPLDGTFLSETPADDTLRGGTPPAAAPDPASQVPDDPATLSSPPASDPAPPVAAEAAPAQVSTPMPAVPDGSIAQRLAMLEAGGQAFREAPWLGHGGQNRFAAARPYLPEGFPDFSHLHNDFLTHAVAGGVPAVALLCLILAFPLLIALRAPPRDRLHTALLFSGAFTGPALVNNVLFVDISAFALAINYTVAIMLVSDPR